MPSRLTGIAWLLLVPLLLVKAQEEALLHINGCPVALNTFQYQYQQQTSESVASFLPQFIDYQLQVRYALDSGLDTLTSFRHQLAYYTGKLIESYSPSTTAEVYSRQQIQTHFARLNSPQWVKVRHITYPLSQHSSAAFCKEAMLFMQQLKALVASATSFEECKKFCSLALPATLVVEELPWKPLSVFLQEWIASVGPLKLGEISEPFLSPIGIHLIELMDVRCEMPNAIELKHTPMHPTLQQQTSSLQGLISGLTASNPDFSLRLQEIKEDLLVTSLLAASPRELSTPTESQLESFFAKNRDRYHWELPHYRGVVVHCKDKATYKRWKKLLKKISPTMWDKALVELTQWVQQPEIAFESGLFQIGQNSAIDKLVFKCGSYVPTSDYPYTFVLGEKLKRPDSYHDVTEVLLLDYKRATAGAWLEGLRRMYKVELDEEVLKTVNNSASN